MNQQQIADLSAELIMKYYDNDYMPFLLHMDDDALWYGPAEGQFIHGREEMIRIWQAEEHSLLFSLGNMEVMHISANPSFCDVMLSYPVTTHYPDREDITLYQRLQMTWCERVIDTQDGEKEKVPRILVCHISNPHAKHDDDVIYPTNFHEVYHRNNVQESHGERVHFHGLDRSDYFFLSDTIIHIEAAHGGKHSVLYTTDGTVEVLSSITALEKRYGHLFLRCHQSYMVNPDYIRNIRRFKVTLTDGTELPIPEKKYTAFRDKAVRRLNDP
ncbi:MAG: LytTR family transcriptional regulator [Ruminococcus sp.]|uniref:LytR/AlgR family response regulator transcription factor n=1 Tax=Ruminococcus sp. TaxID=41978 RepID=UPI0028735C5F|nr:LytTR family DNA-binding domain-containing protein [Ruminococcus sp.]MBQ3285868.1 LytTR family transcriptional regulator [Ruminococcus sp.]